MRFLISKFGKNIDLTDSFLISNLIQHLMEVGLQIVTQVEKIILQL